MRRSTFNYIEDMLRDYPRYMDNYEQLKVDNKRLKKRNEWLEKDNHELNKEIEAAYERIRHLTIRIEELF
ncbi:hypothetical protein ACYUMT_03685 [Latilactobacillus sakei]|uniref:hypothetical protein n=1 Tax=Latilactobacillus sakei TaxID=1599 RepID=UPI000C127A24|nr:hypothetical protein [Latilactobacillus sakei]UNC17043.1 hypothetical protein FX990_02040 [Latilactobacillus sakei]SON68452.1 protein of unknown function [Latilactobacillus sakei]